VAHTPPPITILVGQVTEITDRHLVLAPGTRVVLPQEQSGITAGMTGRLRATREGGQYIAESITPEGGAY
jgi:hypothetical protein